MDNNWKSAFVKFSYLGKYALVAGVVVLISFLYPNSLKFKYEFQKGQIWNYETLEAPFNFVILKPEPEIRKDRESIETGFSPIYRLNSNLPDAKKEDFAVAFEQRISSFSESVIFSDQSEQASKYKDFGVRLLGRIYDKGLIELVPEHARNGNDFVINVLSGNVSNKRTIPGFMTVEQAKVLLFDSLSQFSAPVREFMAPLLEDALAPNLKYDEELTEKLRRQELSELVSTKGMVRKGEVIATKGAVITDDVHDKLISFRKTFFDDVISHQSTRLVYLGYLLLTGLILVVFMMYIQSYRREILQNWNYLIFVLMWLVLLSYMTFLVEKSSLSVYIIPYCIVPIIVRHFFTYRLAFFTHVVVVLISGFLTSIGYQFIFMQIVAGVVAVLAVADARAWSRFFKSVLFILITYLLAYLGLSLIEEGDISKVDWSVYNWIFINGVLTLLAFPLIPLIERAFGFTSSISLVELSDMNRPLLRQLSMKAPGTLQHSLQVANLSEEAANEIGADALLIRVGALYHDVGKMVNPEFFIENQTNISPHEGIDLIESAKIIRDHVPLGVQLAKKHGIPLRIIDFITSHHGTTKVEYFYRKCMQENPGIEVDVSLFTYSGPKPVSKEETILMIADSIEATSRSFNNPTGEDLDNLVDNTIAAKLEKNQLDDSILTFSDLEKCRAVFKKMLRSIYHIRIEYPKG